MDHMHLIGSEEVRRAASEMQSAADTISRAAATINDSVDRLSYVLESFVDRLNGITLASTAGTKESP